jgi:uncharacterized delta-60 repeat protein
MVWFTFRARARRARPIHATQLRLDVLEDRTLLAAGALDTTFGTNGLATTHFPGSTGSSAAALAEQSDGKLVVVGTVATGGNNPTSSLALVRYNPDGTLDTTFGSGGEVTSTAAQNGVALVIEEDGKILVTGTASTGLVVGRFNTNGTLDTTFGTNGFASSTIGGDTADGLTVQASGRILAVGLLPPQGPGIPGIPTSPAVDFLTYLPDGSPDQSFGNHGHTGFGVNHLGGVAFQPDDKIVVAATGTSSFSMSGEPWFVSRWNANGTQDGPFQLRVIDFGGLVGAGIAVEPNGQLLSSGVFSLAGTGLVRLNADGTLDTSFGSGGKLLTDMAGNLAVQRDGSFILAGTSAIERYLPDGSLDRRFGSAGRSALPIGVIGAGGGVIVQLDGNIVAAGSVSIGSNATDFAVARYVGGPSDPLEGTTNQRFVTQLYPDLLSRPVDAAGLASWTSALDAGQLTRAQVVQNIESSLEYRTDVVEVIYQRLLARPADSNGLATWTAFLAAGGTSAQVEAMILGSEEYFARWDHNPVIFLAAVYRDVLNRSPDPSSGVWLDQINGGIPHTQVASAILNSTESFMIQVQRLYHDFLHRAADSSGLQTFVGMLQGGSSIEQVIVALTSSAEYLLLTGPFDLGFGSAGKVQTDFAGNADFAGSVLFQPDGKLVVGGVSRSNSEFDFALARYHPDGSLDTSFGTGGKVQTNFGSLFALALQADQKIVAAGFSGANFGLARYNPDGSLDTTFGSGGKVTMPFAMLSEANTVVVQPDGKILAAGFTEIPSILSPQINLAMARYNPDGSLDASFGTGGKVNGSAGSAQSLALEPDGKILVGVAGNAGRLFRFNPDGTPDASFGSGGQALVHGAPANVSALFVQSDGSILAAAQAPGHFGLARFDASGNPDPSFMLDNSFPTELAGETLTPTRIALAEGGILMGGTMRIPQVATAGFVVAHYNLDGSVDTRFGPGGTFSTDLGTDTDARTVVFASDGKIVVAGVAAASTTNPDFLVARLNVISGIPLGTPNQRFVEQAFLDLLGHPVDNTSFTVYIGQLDQGAITTTQVAQGIIGSASYQTQEVENLYSALLGRAVDPSGLATSTQFLVSGGTVDQLRASILGSDEYFRRNGNINNLFVDAVYRDVLFRAADVRGETAWLNMLANGASRSTIAAMIVGSLECQIDEVQWFYHRLLHRPADNTGLQTFVGELQHGTPSEQILALILGSEEYKSAIV